MKLKIDLEMQLNRDGKRLHLVLKKGKKNNIESMELLLLDQILMHLGKIILYFHKVCTLWSIDFNSSYFFRKISDTIFMAFNKTVS